MPMRKLVIAASLALMIPALACAGMAEHVDRKKIEGIDVIAYPMAIKDVVTIMGALPAGDVIAVANHDKAAATLTALMLDRGTVTQDKFAIARRLEGVGASLHFTVQDQVLKIQALCLKRDLQRVLGLIAEQLRTPAFSPSEFDKARQQVIGQLKNDMDSVQQRSTEAFRGSVFPPGHPNHRPSTDEILTAVQKLTLDEVKTFHRKYYGPDHMALVLVGDIDIARAQGLVAGAFEGWKGGVGYLRDVAPARPAEPQQRSVAVEIPGKTSTVLVIGQGTGLRNTDPDALALQVGTAVLGDPFTGRLMGIVREKEGLTYAIEARLADDTFSDGSWNITGTFAPELLDRGVTSAQRELQHWWADGVTEQELTARKANLIGTYRVELSATTGMARTLLSAVLQGRDVTWLDRYPVAIDALNVKQVNAAIKRYLDPQKMVVVKTGTLPRS
jgi:zinc protease